MAPAMMSAGPLLRSAVIQCVNQPAASPEVQQAAVQVFRLTSVPHEASDFISKFPSDIFRTPPTALLTSCVPFARRAVRFSCRC